MQLSKMKKNLYTRCFPTKIYISFIHIANPSQHYVLMSSSIQSADNGELDCWNTEI
jgi:hypothetical protein